MDSLDLFLSMAASIVAEPTDVYHTQEECMIHIRGRATIPNTISNSSNSRAHVHSALSTD